MAEMIFASVNINAAIKINARILYGTDIHFGTFILKCSIRKRTRQNADRSGHSHSHDTPICE